VEQKQAVTWACQADARWSKSRLSHGLAICVHASQESSPCSAYIVNNGDICSLKNAVFWDVAGVGHIGTDVSEEYIAFIFGVEKIS
jgi:hypothetical protein